MTCYKYIACCTAIGHLNSTWIPPLFKYKFYFFFQESRANLFVGIQSFWKYSSPKYD